MLTIFTGSAGSGKTTQMLQTLCQNGAFRRQICLVPEQYSHEMERRLCEIGGAGTSLYGEILSFTQLANRVFSQAGGLNIPQLDNGGRILLMHRALRAVESQLSVYGRTAKQPSFLSSLITTADELKSYCVQPEQLTLAADSAEHQEKLRDLGLIMGAYQALLAQRAADPRDRLTRLAEALQTCNYFRGCDVYADCFVDFTPQELLVLKEILLQANSLTVVITCGDWGAKGQRPEFESCHRTIVGLQRLATDCGIDCQVVPFEGTRQDWSAELQYLEHSYSAPAATPWEAATRAIELCTCATPFEEVEFAAGKILSLVRETGCRWRDIGVTARTMQGLEEEISRVFQRYGIPISLNRMDDILQKPVLSLITSALSAVSGGYSYDDMFRYLKTGLVGIDPDSRDLLENYVLLWDIKGTKWSTKAPWSWHPLGYSKEWTEAYRELVGQLDGLRLQIITPLEHLRMSDAKTGEQHAMALYHFMEEIGLSGQLEALAQEYTDRGDLNQAEEYSQLWDILCTALEQCATLLEDDLLESDEFSELFRLLLSQYKVGSIPVSLDRVTVGDAPRMSHKNLKYLLVLGATDSAFPQVSESAGLLTDDDRALLALQGLRLAPTANERAQREQTIIYELISLPREQLIVSYPTSSATGEALRPSVLFSRLGELFPLCSRVTAAQHRDAHRLSAPVPALDYLAETRNPTVMQALKAMPDMQAKAERLERSFSTSRGSLSSQGVKALYSRTIAMSASRMDKLKSCHFSYFLQYGLCAAPRKTAALDAPMAGEFVHYVLERLLQDAKPLGGVKALEDDTIRSMTAEITQKYIYGHLGGLDDKSRRFRYLFRRLLRSVDQVVANVVEELRSSDFEPVFFELGFGAGNDIPIQVRVGDLTLSITGFVDRVDQWYHDGRLYYRVVDYKTGKKSFDFTDILNGLSLQMLIYLFILEDQGEKVLEHYAPTPAGVLYLPARDEIISGDRDLDDASRQHALDKSLTRSGLLLNDTEVLDAMEHPGADGIRFLPVRIAKGGKVSGDALVSAEQMGKLRRHIDRTLQAIGTEFSSGNVDADPFYHGARTACNFCEFAAACQFEEGQPGNRRRYQPTVKATEFWAKMDEADAEAQNALPQ